MLPFVINNGFKEMNLERIEGRECFIKPSFCCAGLTKNGGFYSIISESAKNIHACDQRI